MHDHDTPAWQAADDADRMRFTVEAFVDLADRSAGMPDAEIRAEMQRIASVGRELPGIYTAELRE